MLQVTLGARRRIRWGDRLTRCFQQGEEIWRFWNEGRKTGQQLWERKKINMKQRKGFWFYCVLIVAGERWDPATLMFDYSWCGLKKRVLQLQKKK